MTHGISPWKPYSRHSLPSSNLPAMSLTPAQTTLTLSGKLLTLERPVVMGIVNVTPDSFFAGSRIAARRHCALALTNL